MYKPNNHPCTVDRISTRDLFCANSAKWPEPDWTTHELNHRIPNTLLSVTCRMSTLQPLTFVIRLLWHFPDGGWKMSNKTLVEWIPSFLPWIWCRLIDGANSQKECDVPGEETNGTNGELYSPDATRESKLACLWTAADCLALSFCLASLALSGDGLKGQIHSDVFLGCFKKPRHYSLSTSTAIWGKIRNCWQL